VYNPLENSTSVFRSFYAQNNFERRRNYFRERHTYLNVPNSNDLQETSTPQLRGLHGLIKQDDAYPFASGGNSNIYRGKMNIDGRGIRVRFQPSMDVVSE
jgi:hypothetical protein